MSLDSERRDITLRLAELLKMKYDRLKTLEDFNEAIACVTPLLDMPAADEDDVSETLYNLTQLYAEKILHFREATKDDMDLVVGYVTIWLDRVNDGSF